MDNNRTIESFEVAKGNKSGDLLSEMGKDQQPRVGFLACGYFEYWCMYDGLREQVVLDYHSGYDQSLRNSGPMGLVQLTGGFWEGGTRWTKKLANTATSFIESAAGKEKPYFMYLAFNATHDPRQSPKEYVDKYSLENISLPVNFLEEYPYKDSMGCSPDKRDERLVPFPRTPYAIKVNRQEYYALVTYMDEQIGRILEAFEKSGKSENTHIFFKADHGLEVGHHGLAGKQNMYDHSVRVPLMVCGKDIPENKKLDIPVYLQDIMPSTLELAGVEIPDHLEFKSLFPLIDGEESAQYDAIYGAFMDLQRMVTEDGFKLIMYPRVPVARLINLEEDPYEMKDLAGDPAYVAKIKDLFNSFLKLQEETGDTLEIKAVFPDLI